MTLLMWLPRGGCPHAVVSALGMWGGDVMLALVGKGCCLGWVDRVWFLKGADKEQFGRTSQVEEFAWGP